MNKCFKVVFNRTRKCYVVVSEKVSCVQKSTGKVSALLSLTLLLLSSSAQVFAASWMEGGATANGANALAIGISAEADAENSVVFGNTASTKEGASAGVAIGYGATVLASGTNAIALGVRSQVSVGGGVAIGHGSVANTGGNITGFSAFGQTKSGAAWVSGAHGAVSFGGEKFNRQLTGVSAGTKDNDAVNVAQLKDLKSYGDSTFMTEDKANTQFTTLTNKFNDYATTAAMNTEFAKYTTTEDLVKGYASADAFNSLNSQFESLSSAVGGLDSDTVNLLKEVAPELNKMKDGLLQVVTKPQGEPDTPVDPVDPPENIINAKNDDVGGVTTPTEPGEPSTPSDNKATLGIGGQLAFESDKNFVITPTGDESGNVTVKIESAKDQTFDTVEVTNQLTAKDIVATTVKADEMSVNNSFMVGAEGGPNTIIAGNKITLSDETGAAGTILTGNRIETGFVTAQGVTTSQLRFDSGAVMSYNNETGRLQYSSTVGREGGTYNVATTSDGISFAADNGEAVKVNLEDQSVAIKGGDEFITTSVVANDKGGATIEVKTTDAFKLALGNGNLNDGITIGAKDGYEEIRVKQGDVNMGGNRIQNIGDGVAPTDAVNKRQLDNATRSLHNKINDVDKDLRAGIAMAMAVGNLPQAYMPGKSIVAMSAGTYHGQGGFALGLSHAMENRSWIFKGAASVDTRGNFGGTVSAGYQF